MSLPVTWWAEHGSGVLLLLTTGFVVNVPLGVLRARSRPRTLKWLIYVHASIPVLLLLRRALGMSVWVIPFSLTGAVLGQIAGGVMQARSQSTGKPCPPGEASPCTTGAARMVDDSTLPNEELSQCNIASR
ncbi:MAG: hypothetical protein COS85_14830 [Armatimonadetes bacterium CG07_land_8_20_14_0_80_59_28]|nr:MAG: hypothetical protein COS85_14830 [Armatimonadetes bacterium CG07_land_8_20_14_0_80_59_28]